MNFEQDDRPDEPPGDQPDEPPFVSPPKKSDREKISSDEYSTNAQHPSNKPRSNPTPLADRTEDFLSAQVSPRL